MLNQLVKTLAMSIGIAAAVSSPAIAEDYPEKAITVIVNYGAGGGTDLSTRALSEAAEEFLGQPTQVLNKTGGSGTVGPTFISNAKPDGYTIGVTSFSPMALTPHTQPVAYTTESFRYLAGYARYMYAIAVPGSSPHNTIAELVTDATDNGKTIKYGSASTIGTVAATRFGNATGVEMKWIRFNSDAEMNTAILNGTVDMIVGNPKQVEAFVTAGDMKALASASSIRLPGLPDVPTLREQGIDMAVESYAGLGAPAGITDEQAAFLENAFKKAFDKPEFQETLAKLGLQPAYFTGAEYQKLVEEGYAQMGEDLAALGLKTH